jgi:hypothetical protein
MTDEERLIWLERKATETRKLLFGSLVLAKDVWEKELSQSPEGLEIMKAVEEAEESFADSLPMDRLKRLEHIMVIINRRAKSMFDLMTHVERCRRE